MKVELFYTPGCSRCTAVQAELKVVAERAVHHLVWRDVDALEELDYAVELGVLTLPAIAIDGKLVFSSLPTPNQLREALTRVTGAA
ncbi:thioredoxin family protein [Paraburkholderia dilworthii]|uniref:Thioredoxin family protein n=1 Tax=Paraburkholderia dilworthii TaxID=948106 RepID=A0ABW9DGU7_9BURK